MKLGDAFHMPVADQEIDHLHFVISDPTKHPVVLVNVTKDGPRAHFECKMNPKTSAAPADHPAIKEVCYVDFADAIVLTAEQAKRLDFCLQKRLYRSESPLSKDGLAKVLGGARNSKALETGLKKYIPAKP